MNIYELDEPIRILTSDLHSYSYPTQVSGGAGRRNHPYDQRDDDSYEMSDVKDSTTHLAPSGDMASFYAEVGYLRT